MTNFYVKLFVKTMSTLTCGLFGTLCASLKTYGLGVKCSILTPVTALRVPPVTGSSHNASEVFYLMPLTQAENGSGCG